MHHVHAHWCWPRFVQATLPSLPCPWRPIRRAAAAQQVSRQATVPCPSRAAMVFNWASSAAPLTGKTRSKFGGTPQKTGSGPQRGYGARMPTSTEFSRTWSTIGHISPADKMTCLERCDDKFSKEALIGFAQDEDALDAMIWVATGWQPGLELFERDRDNYFQYFLKQHSRKGYPLRELLPDDCVKLAAQHFGHIPTPCGLPQLAQEPGGLQEVQQNKCGLQYSIDVAGDGTAFISNGQLSTLLPRTGRPWSITADGVATDGLVRLPACSFFYARARPAVAPRAVSTAARATADADAGTVAPNAEPYTVWAAAAHAAAEAAAAPDAAAAAAAAGAAAGTAGASATAVCAAAGIFRAAGAAAVVNSAAARTTADAAAE